MLTTEGITASASRPNSESRADNPGNAVAPKAGLTLGSA
jgi:hypothetical protein